MDSTRALGASDYNGSPRSFPQVYNALFVGHTNGTVGSVSTDSSDKALMRLREGTGGAFGNIVVANVGDQYMEASVNAEASHVVRLRVPEYDRRLLVVVPEQRDCGYVRND